MFEFVHGNERNERILHLCTTVQIHSMHGCLNAGSIQTPHHLCYNRIDMSIVQPAVTQMLVLIAQRLVEDGSKLPGIA